MNGYLTKKLQHEEDILGLELNYKIRVPCVVQWSP